MECNNQSRLNKYQAMKKKARAMRQFCFSVLCFYMSVLLFYLMLVISTTDGLSAIVKFKLSDDLFSSLNSKPTNSYDETKHAKDLALASEHENMWNYEIQDWHLLPICSEMPNVEENMSNCEFANKDIKYFSAQGNLITKKKKSKHVSKY